jgi:hypothetical protein
MVVPGVLIYGAAAKDHVLEIMHRLNVGPGSINAYHPLYHEVETI